MTKSEMPNREQQQKRTSLAAHISLSSLGWELVLPMFVGVLIGYQLDQYFNVKFIFSLVFLLSGIGVGYYNLYKTIELNYLRTKVAQMHVKEEDRPL